MPDNKFLSILKKIGMGVNLVGQVAFPPYAAIAKQVALLTPGDKDDKIVDAVTHGVDDKLNLIAAAVAQAEIMGSAIGAKGEDKAKMIAVEVDALLQTLPIIKGKKPEDPVAARKISEQIAGLVADYINLYKA